MPHLGGEDDVMRLEHTFVECACVVNGASREKHHQFEPFTKFRPFLMWRKRGATP